MTVDQVKEILTRRFADEEDRKYWERKLVELEAKECRIKENEKYFNKRAVYDR